MATEKQPRTSKENITKTQAKRRTAPKIQRPRPQTQGPGRAKPGSTGEGDYFHIEVRGKTGFVAFRTQDVGRKGHIQRVGGRHAGGAWDTVKWLISKKDAHRRGSKLVADTAAARKVLEELSTVPTHISGDRFKAKPRPNVSERKKPTAAQQRARQTNIKKAQAARTRRA